MSQYNFELSGVSGNWKIEIDPAAQYGYFENQKTGAGGGLWFDSGALSDYDGVFELPVAVVDLIVEQGYVVID